MEDRESSLLGIDNSTSRLQYLLLTTPRDLLHRSTALSTLAKARLKRYEFSNENEDLDMSISYSTEAILLPFAPPLELVPNVRTAFVYLAVAFFLRSRKLKRPSDINYTIKYLRYLRDQSLETSGITRSDITTYLIRALTIHVQLESVDPMRDIDEMANLCLDLLAVGISEEHLIDAVNAFVNSMRVIPLTYGQPSDEVIKFLLEAKIRLPDQRELSPLLVTCLGMRFYGTRSHDDYEKAMSIVDEMIADPSRDVQATRGLAGLLSRSRLEYYKQPEDLERAIFRTHAQLDALSSEDPNRRSVTDELALLEKTRFDQFGVTSNWRQSGADDTKAIDDSHLAASPKIAKSDVVEFPLTIPDKRNPEIHFDALVSMTKITDLADIEKAIEYCRLCLTSPHPDARFTHFMFADLLLSAFHLTANVERLNESITSFRDLLKVPGAHSITPHYIARRLISSLSSRFSLFWDRKDRDEIMQLFTVATTDPNMNVSDRFNTSCEWTLTARRYGHPSTPTAYETAISLMQESLSFAPTLEIQHFRLVAMRKQYEKLPLDYASYCVHIGQLKQAIEILERGRGLLWSEMRGLRASIDQLRAVNRSLAEKFEAVNSHLESLTMSSSPMNDVEDHEGMSPFGRLVIKRQKLVEDRDKLISQIRAQPNFGTYLIPPSFDTLRSSAACGPVILINHSEWRSDIIILLHNSPPSLIPTTTDFYDCAKGLKDKLLAARKKDLDSREYEDALCCVLEKLYDLVGRPVIQRLRELNVPEQSRVWWCPTSVFCSLPLHAMGPIRSDGRTKLYFSDIYITSYTPTLSALIESRKPNPQPLDKPSMLLVVQPDAQMPSALREMRLIQNVCPLVETLVLEGATANATLERLRKHRFAHISCHGKLETGKPFDAFFELHGGTRLTLLDVVRSRLPTAEFAFLSACHTAEITEQSVADEGLHLAAAVQYSGFRSVVGTMWAMADIDGPVIAESFYKSVFSDRQQGKPYYERTAEALRDAVRNLRRKRRVTLERWVNFVHHGA
ncbi:CHAT domain-containing protein [Russula compacta]|nr:CHAT domain-containing protein [Russula compacta]